MTLEYRYTLYRKLEVDPMKLAPLNNGHLLYVMMNPSIASDTVSDPTIKRCIGFAARWGYSSFSVVNLWAMRATKPRVLWGAIAAELDAVGPENDKFISFEAAQADAVCCAWGAINPAFPRVQKVLELLLASKHTDLYCIGTTKDGSPKHPLYAKYGDRPLTWRRRKEAA